MPVFPSCEKEVSSLHCCQVLAVGVVFSLLYILSVPTKHLEATVVAMWHHINTV